MANVFSGPTDARQSEEAITPTRFRPRYRQLTEKEKALHDDIKAKAEELEKLLDLCGHGRYHALAITALEESIMWAIKQLTQ